MISLKLQSRPPKAAADRPSGCPEKSGKMAATPDFWVAKVGFGPLKEFPSSPAVKEDRPTVDMSHSAADTPPPEEAPAEATAAPQGEGLGVITEGVGELAVIDPEVAQKACEEVLEKVKSMHCVSPDGSVRPEDRKAGGRWPGLNGECCEIKCLDDPPEKIWEEDEHPPNSVKGVRRRQRNNSAKQSWLLRLFESKLFDVSMAISYLYNSKEPGVQAYIGNRLFCFRKEDVDFYLPQLLNMYIHMDEDVGDAIKPYIVHRCRQSVNFSLQCALLLGAYSSDMHISTQRHSRGTKLRRLILSDELKPAPRRRELPPLVPAPEAGLSPTKRTHQRSKSDATASISLASSLKRTASNPKVENADEVSPPSRAPAGLPSQAGWGRGPPGVGGASLSRGICGASRSRRRSCVALLGHCWWDRPRGCVNPKGRIDACVNCLFSSFLLRKGPAHPVAGE